MFHILLVEDIPDQAALVHQALTGPELQVRVVASVHEARRELEREDVIFHLFILDLWLPDGDGFEVLKDIKSHMLYRDTAVWLLSVADEIPRKVAAFNLGADDYLIKSIKPDELRARVDARLRRIEASKEIFQKGRLRLDLPLMKAFMQEESRRMALDLTPTEFKILSLLARHEGHVYNREEIVRTIWGDNVNVLNRTVDSHISGLRRKLGTLSNYIESVAGSGYRFTLPNG